MLLTENKKFDFFQDGTVRASIIQRGHEVFQVSTYNWYRKAPSLAAVCVPYSAPGGMPQETLGITHTHIHKERNKEQNTITTLFPVL